MGPNLAGAACRCHSFLNAPCKEYATEEVKPAFRRLTQSSMAPSSVDGLGSHWVPKDCPTYSTACKTRCFPAKRVKRSAASFIVPNWLANSCSLGSARFRLPGASGKVFAADTRPKKFTAPSIKSVARCSPSILSVEYSFVCAHPDRVGSIAKTAAKIPSAVVHLLFIFRCRADGIVPASIKPLQVDRNCLGLAMVRTSPRAQTL